MKSSNLFTSYGKGTVIHMETKYDSAFAVNVLMILYENIPDKSFYFEILQLINAHNCCIF